jgi:outer membrane protein TolC
MLAYSEALELGSGSNTSRRVMLQQVLPNLGKLDARHARASANAASLAAAYEAERLAVHERIQIAHANLQSLAARQAIIVRLAQALRAIEMIIQARVTTDLVPLSTLLRVQTEVERLESDARTLGQQRLAEISALAAGVGLRIPTDVDLPLLPTLAHTLPPHAELSHDLHEHPEILERIARSHAAAAQLREARWARIPDLQLGLEFEPDPSRLGATIGITIPWQRHVLDARVAQAQAEQDQADAELAQRRLDLEARLERALFAHTDAIRVIALQEQTVLPKARQSLDLLLTDFKSDRAGLTDVLDGERSLLAAELALVEARAALLVARARLDALTGHRLDTSLQSDSNDQPAR